ncbi:hypothetical protein [Kineosporia succinea]|uniref:Uncharacterized protein n=1 Tax=Kineosporia succinea TaxID=84632 RepID=A0ABT9P8Q5_9ACTN|nr:hypothetical protein [Kineosporia succinea]MDP9829078.1 hypothetical protein [Kineosporia succinea]
MKTSAYTEIHDGVTALAADLGVAAASLRRRRRRARELAEEMSDAGWDGIAAQTEQAVELLAAAHEQIHDPHPLEALLQVLVPERPDAEGHDPAAEHPFTREHEPASAPGAGGPPGPGPAPELPGEASEELAAAGAVTESAAAHVDEAAMVFGAAGLDTFSAGLQDLRDDLAAIAERLAQLRDTVEASLAEAPRKPHET